jgi:hypothetical protein
MDRRRQTRRPLIGAALAVASFAIAAASAAVPLRAARWVPADRQLQALATEPTECLAWQDEEHLRRRVAMGRAAFRTPLLLGGQAARAGLSCDSCHRNGRGNPDLQFPGLSGAPGTADVTSSLMSSHRGDGRSNPTSIPDLSGPLDRLKISREPTNRALESFIRGLIVEEFDGAEPSALTLDSIASYVRALSPRACPDAATQRISLASYLADARAAALAAQYALDANDFAAARLMLASARSALGLIDERYATPALGEARAGLREADRELAVMQTAVDLGSSDASLRITTWLAKVPRWSRPLQATESLSLFDQGRLKTIVGSNSHSPSGALQ